LITPQIYPNPELHQTKLAAPRLVAVIGFAALLGIAIWMIPMSALLTRVLVAAGVTLLIVALGMAIRAQMLDRLSVSANHMLRVFIEHDSSPSFVVDADGVVQTRNLAAAKRFANNEGETLAANLRAILANPSAVLYRLQCRAALDGSAREDVMTRRGPVRLAVHKLSNGSNLWRIEDLPDRGQPGRGSEGLPIPMITAGRSGAVLFMNDAARHLVGERVKSLDRLFAALPLRSGHLTLLNTDSGPVRVLPVEYQTSAGRRELYFLPIDKVDPGVDSAGFEALPVPMIRVAVTGEILAANSLAAQLLALDTTRTAKIDTMMEGLGRPMQDWLKETAAGRAGQKSEFLRLRRRDREIFVQVTLSRVLDQDEPELIAVLNDATELKTLEAQFVQSQKMQAIGQLAGGVAHDFNNLLTAISGHCDLLLLRHDQGDQDFGDLVQISENANRAAALVGQLLAFSRKQTLQPEVLDLRDTLSDLTHLLNRLVGEKVTLTLCHDPVLRAIRADKRQLEQVLMNLVVNARDAMPDGGEIRIETEVVTLDVALERDRATVPPGTYATVKVTDEGVGIDSDKQQKIFEPFYTTKRTGEGTGLGLSTVYGIVKQTGGFIFVDSAAGSGTQFTLFFPVDEAETRLPCAPEPKAAHPQSETGDGVVLLVEDEAPVRAFASRALQMRGYTVLEASCAEEALSALEDPNLTIDVFVTDVIMPGMDGPTWVRKALKQRPDVRVVFVSGYAEGAFGDAQPDIPNSVFLPKPFSLTQLTETVHGQLH
jgi:two-component system, cell cycle sensor histidine kinase and response regulator CckA